MIHLTSEPPLAPATDLLILAGILWGIVIAFAVRYYARWAWEAYKNRK